MVKPMMTIGLALAGRERERNLLRAHWRDAVAGRGGLIVIGGEAGVGKTALAEELLREVATVGTVLIGRCYDLIETPPYGPWREALAALPTLLSHPALPSALVSADGDGVIVAGWEATFAQARAALAARAVERPLAILLDDLQWADPASLDLLRALGRHLVGLPILLLATCRDELSRRHPLFQLLPILVREAGALQLPLRMRQKSDNAWWERPDSGSVAALTAA